MRPSIATPFFEPGYSLSRGESQVVDASFATLASNRDADVGALCEQIAAS
jgi:hypothetical protein